MSMQHKERGTCVPDVGVRHHSCGTAHGMKFMREVYLSSWRDAPVVSMGMGRAAQ